MFVVAFYVICIVKDGVIAKKICRKFRYVFHILHYFITIFSDFHPEC